MVHSYDPRDLEETEALADDLGALHRAVPIGDMRKALATAHHMALRELRQHLLDTEAITDGQDPGAMAIRLLQSMAATIKRLGDEKESKAGARASLERIAAGPDEAAAHLATDVLATIRRREGS